MKKHLFSNTHLILLSFLAAIAVGSLLLALPISTASGEPLSMTDAVFCATTSVCVTGLVTVPIASLSLFGQIVVLILIQMGGLGVVTVMSAFTLAFHRKMGLGDRLLLQDAFNLNGLSGVVKFIRRVIAGTFAVEGVGALVIMTAFVPRYGLRGVWYAVFHAISAFCNAGLDLLGTNSLIDWADSPLVCGVTEILIVLGGLGFVVWWDLARVIRERRKIRDLTLHSKIALTTTLFLIFSGAVLFFFLEGFAGSPDLSYRLRVSLFQSVTARTAGFAVVPQETLGGGSVLVTCLLMFIGGSPVGTAGGIKTVTAAVLAAFTLATVRGKKEVSLFHRRIPRQSLSRAVAVAAVSFTTVLFSTLLLCVCTEGSLTDLFFEAVSATATVGLTRGATGILTGAGKWIVIVTMYLGRVGPISLAVAFGSKRENQNLIRDPEEEISVG